MNGSQRRWGLGLTLVVTNAIKLGGLGVAIDQIFVAPSPKGIYIALAAFMMAGAQGVEEALLSFVERFFGVTPHDAAPPKRRKQP